MVTDSNQQEITKVEIIQPSFCSSLFNDRDTFKLTIFLLITLGFAFIEFFSGYVANSLSLMSDSVHMLFDSSALAIAVYAQIKAKAPANILHSFGFERYKVLAGYINGIFLLFIAFFIFIEAIDRMVNPPKIMSNLIILVAIIGFIINIIGLIFFHGHSGLSPAHSHAHAHSHSCNYTIIIQNRFFKKIMKIQTRIQLLYSCTSQLMLLVVLVLLLFLKLNMFIKGVIISAILIKYWKLYRSDPITSAIISLLIIASLIPLMKSSGKLLLQSYDSKHQKKLEELLSLQTDPDILQFQNIRLWSYVQNKLIFTISLIRKRGTDEIALLKKTQDLLAKFHAIKETTIQIQEEELPNKESLQLQLVHRTLQFDTIEIENGI